MFLLMFTCINLQYPQVVYSLNISNHSFRLNSSVFMDGHAVITAIFPLYFWEMKNNILDPDGNHILVKYKLRNFQIVLSLAFAIEEINRNPHILPNISLGFDVYNIPFTERNSMNISFTWLSGMDRRIPNYTCRKESKYIAVLTGTSWATSAQIGTLVELYKIPQISFGPFDPILSGHFTSLYQMAPKDTFLTKAMVSLMLHFHWNWVGLFISDDHKGAEILSDFKREMDRNRICIAFVQMVPVSTMKLSPQGWPYFHVINMSSANVIAIYVDTDSPQGLLVNIGQTLMTSKVWIMNSKFDASVIPNNLILESFHSTLIFSHKHKEISGFADFIHTVNPFKYPNDIFLARIWVNFFNCTFSASYYERLDNCLENASLELLPGSIFDMAMSEESYNVHKAVYVVAHTLHEMLLRQVEMQSVDNSQGLEISSWKLHPFLKKILINNFSCDHVILDGQWQCDAEYDILNYWNFPHGLGLKMKVGMYSQFVLQGQKLSINEDLIEWAIGITETPRSVCSESCGPGFRKTYVERKPVCCFDCIPCTMNEISNETDMDQCIKCGDNLYANKENNKCIHKAVTFLHYDDPLGMALACLALCFSSLTAAILGVFVKFHDTPIVKANNRNLSYILLTSLIFCFLCSLLFIGHPNTCTCILQQTTFGVVFTVALSTVLTKTIIVLLAFKITVPGRRMRWLLQSKAPNFIIPFSILVQLVLCGIWLGTSPPFIDVDVHSEFGHILIICNKGSVTAFYCVLGFLGFLALLSFTVAFLVKNLPDTFNEAKFLTFSMLVFCSVWITFVPVYHSTKGKAMVATEIFSILASSAGLLICIFLPKCCIILLRPEKIYCHEHRNKKLPGGKKPS